MAVVRVNKRARKIIQYVLLLAIIAFGFLLFFINRFIEPMLRDRLHTLIVQGSDSLYRYQLGNLNANFFGGNVEVENLHIQVDSSRYKQLAETNALPSLTMQLDLQKGRIRGLGVMALLFGKKIKITEILSKEADIKLSRHIRNLQERPNTIPLWKAIQPVIRSISIDRINLDGVKLLYKNADTSESIKLQFDRCVALFKNIKVDSIASVDTTRIAFAQSINMQFYDLKFRTPDSAYKMKAEVIDYSSDKKRLQIKDFKIQPTLEKEEFFKTARVQKSRYEVEFDDAVFTNLRIDRFIYSNIIAADSVFLTKPQLRIENDKTLPPTLENKFGKYPHQSLLKANSTIIVKAIKITDGDVSYTEKNEKTKKEGKLSFESLSASIANVTNDANMIRQNAQCIANVEAKVLGMSPIETRFTFFLDSREGRFDAKGQVQNLNGKELNAIAEPLSNIQIQSVNIGFIQFDVHGDDYSANGNVRMNYNNLAITLRKRDDETGAVKTKKFLTKLINKFTIYPSNPSEGVQRVADNVVYARTSSKSFFGVVWKTVFAGMQNIMMKTGRYE